MRILLIHICVNQIFILNINYLINSKSTQQISAVTQGTMQGNVEEGRDRNKEFQELEEFWWELNYLLLIVLMLISEFLKFACEAIWSWTFMCLDIYNEAR